MNEKKRTGIFGGTFNPPHIGHFEIAEAAKKVFDLNRIFFVPSYFPPHKDIKSVAGAGHRGEMVKLLIKNNSDFLFSDYELSKQGVSYSIDTVKYFKTEFPEDKFYFITGSDAFYHIDSWKDFKQLIGLMEFIVYMRKGVSKKDILKKYGSLNGLYFIDDGFISISSSKIRMMLRDDLGCREDLGEEIEGYIKKNRLYEK